AASLPVAGVSRAAAPPLPSLPPLLRAHPAAVAASRLNTVMSVPILRNEYNIIHLQLAWIDVQCERTNNRLGVSFVCHPREFVSPKASFCCLQLPILVGRSEYSDTSKKKWGWRHPTPAAAPSVLRAVALDSRLYSSGIGCWWAIPFGRWE